MTVSVEMVVPGMVGYWIDQKLETRVLFTLFGIAIGVTLGIWHLIRMTKQAEDNRRTSSKDSRQQ